MPDLDLDAIEDEKLEEDSRTEQIRKRWEDGWPDSSIDDIEYLLGQIDELEKQRNAALAEAERQQGGIDVKPHFGEDLKRLQDHITQHQAYAKSQYEKKDQNNKETMFRIYADAVDRVFQQGAHDIPAILPDFDTLGKSKLEAVIRLAIEYKRLKAAIAESERQKYPLLVCDCEDAMHPKKPTEPEAERPRAVLLLVGKRLVEIFPPESATQKEIDEWLSGMGKTNASIVVPQGWAYSFE